ncbi:uncharacterized protein METZ01_LOCUS210612 [marine metagenome]|uniref:Uncharacterized protein n=1 Tax=marine metagenome TaxID=408172 RepID=A0A382F413_9ZZZZ
MTTKNNHLHLDQLPVHLLLGPASMHLKVQAYHQRADQGTNDKFLRTLPKLLYYAHCSQAAWLQRPQKPDPKRNSHSQN